MCEESNQVSRLSCEACSSRVRDHWVTGRSRIVGEVGKYYANITTRTIFKLVFSDHDSPLQKFQHLVSCEVKVWSRSSMCR
jgi:hypothetical protein